MTEILKAGRSDRRPVQEDAAAGRLIESKDQPGDRRLPASRPAKEPENLPPGKQEADAIENRFPGDVGEGDGPELQVQGLSGGKIRSGAIEDLRLDLLQLANPLDTGADALEAVDLHGELANGTGKEVDVVDEKEHGSDRHDTGAVEHVSGNEGRGEADREDHPCDHADAEMHDAGCLPMAEDLPVYGIEPVHHVAHRPAGADVFRAGKPFLEEPGQLGGVFPQELLRTDSDVPDEAQRPDGEGGKEREQAADAGVFEEKNHEDAGHEEDVRQDAHDELGEEIGELGDISVDALDELPGSRVVVILNVEGDAVGGEIGPELIRRAPCDVFSDIGTRDPECLLEHGHGDEKGRGEDQGPPHFPLARSVDHRTYDLRVHELKRNASADQEGEEGERRRALSKIFRKDLPIAAERYFHSVRAPFGV